jgi:hypothetical protein
MEMDNHDNFIRSTRLIEAVLNIAETDVNLLALMRRVAKTVLMNFQISNGLLANKVWSDH